MTSIQKQTRPFGQPLKNKQTGDGGRLYHTSHSLLLAREDKTYPGAMIASLSIPWGESRGDDDIGGYHLIWTRDMVNSATGLLAAGKTETPLRSLIYLACSQLPDGGFHQNFWINGDPYWTGIQLDEVAFPIMLAWRLHEAGALRDFDPYPMVLRAASYPVRQGPATPQERWEENSGYSPSTLASNIAALICAASLRTRARRSRHGCFPRTVRGLSGMSRRVLDGYHRGNARARHPQALHPHPSGGCRQSRTGRGSERGDIDRQERRAGAKE